MLFLNNAEEIVKLIVNEKVILMQTDTIFGLVCRGDNIDCIRRVENIKHRNNHKFSFFVRDLNVAEKYVKMNKKQKQIFKQIFPGYFTLIFEAQSDYILEDNEYEKQEKKNCGKIPKICYGINKFGKKTLGLRVPNNKMCLEVLELIDFPILATSANISKQSSPTTFDSIDNTILKSVDAVFYDKNAKIENLNSTIIDLSHYNYDNRMDVIRYGSGEFEQLSKFYKFS